MTNTILEHVLKTLKQDYPVSQIEVSAHWTLVISRSSGLASTIVGCGPHGEQLVRQAGDLLENSALELASLCLSENTLEAGIGMAAVNSLIEPPLQNRQVINIADVLAERGNGKRIAMIGHFPFIKKLKGIAREVWVIDLQPAEDEFGPEQAAQILPEADILAMTGNTLITKAAEDYLAMCRPDALKIMMGPSTPMTPVLFEHGLDILAGVRVVDPSLVSRYISQGAAFSQVQGIEKITLSA